MVITSMRNLLTWIRRKCARSGLDRELEPPLRLPVLFRTYESRDFDSLMDIYRLNAPGRFPAGDEARFAAFLQAGPDGIIVGELEGKPVCCAVLELSGKNIFTFCYNLIHPDYQGQRLGTTLTLLRVAATGVGNKPGVVHHALVFTVPAAMSYYQRFDFKEYGTWTSSDGQEHPAAVLAYDTQLTWDIAGVLKWRKIEIKGDFKPAISQAGEAKFTKDELGKKCIRFAPWPQSATNVYGESKS